MEEMQAIMIVKPGLSLKEDDVKRLACTEKSMARRMCNATVRVGQTSEELSSGLGNESISGIMRMGRLY